MYLKDIDKYHLDDLKCDFMDCDGKLRFLMYDKFYERDGFEFIVARMACVAKGHAITVIPVREERIYIDSPNAYDLKKIENVHIALASMSVDMEGEKIPLSWKLSEDFWGFREDFSDALKAKMQIIRVFEKKEEY